MICAHLRRKDQPFYRLLGGSESRNACKSIRVMTVRVPYFRALNCLSRIALYSEVCPIEATAAASWIVKASFSTVGRSIDDSRLAILIGLASLAAGHSAQKTDRCSKVSR